MFTKPLQDVEIMEKDTTKLVCEVSKPHAEVKWFKNGVEIIPGVRYKVDSKDVQRELIIMNATLEDTSEYTCVLTSSQAKTRANVTVKGNATRHAESEQSPMVQNLLMNCPVFRTICVEFWA